MVDGESAPPGRVVVNTLGPLEVLVDGRGVSLPPAQRRLLSILLLTPGRECSTDELIDRMWGDDPPATARAAVQVHVAGLRKAVPLVTTPGGYRLDPTAVENDRVLLEHLVDDAEAARAALDWGPALRHGERASALWRGRPFPELADEAFAAGTITRVDQLFLTAADIEVESLLALGRNEAATLRLGDLVDRHPFHERLWRHLMLALYRAGRQGEALRAFQNYRRLLGEAMGIEPGEDLRDLEDRILLQDPALGSPPAPVTPHNLPETATSFVGRDDDLRLMSKELAEARIVSIVGGPGFGKTRLAIEVGRHLLADYPGGVWFAGLGGAEDARAVTATIAAAVSAGEGVESLESLAGDLRSRPMLLILDNCEHVIDPVSRFILALSTGQPTCRVLVTSRRRLGIHGESVSRLQPLANRLDESVALLADRVRAIDRGFTVTPENLDALLEVCARLEGIPLAIELVARWAPGLGLTDVGRLLDRIQADTALETAFEWSVALLPEGDRDLLCSLAVFESTFTLDRAAEVCGADQTELATAGCLSRLVDASLLGLDLWGTSARYRMLQPIRELAWGRVRPGDRRSLAERHARSFLRTAVDLRVSSVEDAQATAFATLDMEIVDYRRAMAHLRDGRTWTDLTTVIEALSRYWYARFLGWEGREWTADVPRDELEPEDRARLDRVAGFLAWAVHDYDEADRHYSDLHALGVERGDRLMEADGLYGRGLVHQKRRYLDGASMLEEAAGVYSSLDGCEVQLGECLLFRGLDEAYTGDLDRAEELLGRAVELLDAAGNLRQVSKGHRWLAHCAWRRGQENLARHHAGVAEGLARSVGDHIALCGALVEQAHIAISWGEAREAAGHVLEALEPIPQADEIDLAQVLLPAARLAVRCGEQPLARAIIDHIDDVYDRHGWRLLDETQGAVDIREVLVDVGPAGGDVGEGVRTFLVRIAGPG
jgi:predicted ATPase/DNA-binding SARP family transcriptional activator